MFQILNGQYLNWLYTHKDGLGLQSTLPGHCDWLHLPILMQVSCQEPQLPRVQQVMLYWRTAFYNSKPLKFEFPRLLKYL